GAGRSSDGTNPAALARSLGRASFCPSDSGAIPVSEETASGLKCRLCGKTYPKEALNFCTEDFGPLEVTYDYEAVARTLGRESLAARPRSMWRYHELLPVDGEPTVGRQVGCTPLVRPDRLARAPGV